MTRNALAVELLPEDDPASVPGAYYFVYHGDQRSQPSGIVHTCPCGCGKQSMLWFKGQGRGHPEWIVIGAWPDVTLEPSIGIKPMVDGKYHWHGYLRKGVFEEC